MRRVRAIFRPRPLSLPPDDDLNNVRVVGDDEGPEGPGGAPVLARPPGDVLADGQVPHGEPQVTYLDSYWFSDV